jgi:hypothetical protein
MVRCCFPANDLETSKLKAAFRIVGNIYIPLLIRGLECRDVSTKPASYPTSRCCSISVLCRGESALLLTTLSASLLSCRMYMDH